MVHRLKRFTKTKWFLKKYHPKIYYQIKDLLIKEMAPNLMAAEDSCMLTGKWPKEYREDGKYPGLEDNI